MKKGEREEIEERFCEVYRGILHGSSEFLDGEKVGFEYRFDCPQYQELKQKYPIEQVAGKGGAFERALRLARWLKRNLAHDGNYGDRPCNAVALLDHSFAKPDMGINCKSKAKILVECCLALGIYARRLWLLPNSPYDMDCHVVAEIYDGKRKKWLVLDPTTGGYFTDGSQPLGVLEVRERFSRFAPCSVVLPRQNARNAEALALRNRSMNCYYMKNFFFLALETVSAFGEEGKSAFLSPAHFSVREWSRRNAEYRLETALRLGAKELALSAKEELVREDEYTPRIGSIEMWLAPN